MNQRLTFRAALPCLVLAIAILFSASRAAGAVELPSAPTSEDATETSSLTAELSQVAEELCGQALFNFKAVDVPPASISPILAALIPTKNEDEAAANPKSAKIVVNRTASKELNQALTEFVNGVQIADGEKVTKITQEIVVAKDSELGAMLKLEKIHGELKKTLNDKNNPPFTDDDMNDFVSMISDYFSPIKIRRAGNNFGPEDYCFKSTFETNKRKFRLNLIKHGENYLWFVEDVI